MPSIVGTVADYKIVHLLLIVNRNVHHVSYTSSAMVLPAIEQERLTFRTMVIYGYDKKEEAIFNARRSFLQQKSSTKRGGNFQPTQILPVTKKRVLPAIEQKRLTFRTMVIYGYDKKEEAIFNTRRSFLQQKSATKRGGNFQRTQILPATKKRDKNLRQKSATKIDRSPAARRIIELLLCEYRLLLWLYFAALAASSAVFCM